jgi:hypothetical protein
MVGHLVLLFGVAGAGIVFLRSASGWRQCLLSLSWAWGAREVYVVSRVDVCSLQVVCSSWKKTNHYIYTHV